MDKRIIPIENIEIYCHIFSIIKDITQRKEFEKEMSRLSRLNLIGEMAAGIGHEIRNPLTTVQILGAKEECFQHKEYFDLIIGELDRANSMITEFLSLAKTKTLEYKLININFYCRSSSSINSGRHHEGR